MPDYNYQPIDLNSPVRPFSGGLMGGGQTGFMPSLGGGVATAGRAGAAIATGGTSEIISQVLNIVPSILQGITGAIQLSRARKIEEQNPRPEATIAPSINKLVNYAYGQTLSNDIPGGDIYRNQINSGLATGLKAASELGSGSEAYGALSGMVGGAGNNLAELAKFTAQDIAGKQEGYKSALGVKAGEENRVWDWNKAQPYLQAAQTAQMLRDSGLRNINSGVKNVFGSTAEYINPDFSSSLLWDSGKGNSRTTYTPEELAALVDSLKGVGAPK